MRPVFALAVSASILLGGHAQAQQAYEGEFLNLSFTGDGATPSSMELFEAQQQALQPMRQAGNVSDQGDFSWSVPVELPPALLSPDLALDYSSAAGSHSTIARGWSLRAGMTITRVTGAEWDQAYDGLEVYRIAGGGLSGILFFDGGEWMYASNGVIAASIEKVGDEWVVGFRGVTTWLSPADSGPNSWHARRVRDGSGNRVDYEWGVEPLVRASQLLAVEFGGSGAASGSLTNAHIVRVELAYEPHPHPTDRYNAGTLDRITDRLTGIEVWTDPSGTGSFPHLASGVELLYEEVDSLEVLAEVRSYLMRWTSRPFRIPSKSSSVAQIPPTTRSCPPRTQISRQSSSRPPAKASDANDERLQYRVSARVRRL